MGGTKDMNVYVVLLYSTLDSFYLLSHELVFLFVNYIGLPKKFGQNSKSIVLHREKKVEISADDW